MKVSWGDGIVCCTQVCFAFIICCETIDNLTTNNSFQSMIEDPSKRLPGGRSLKNGYSRCVEFPMIFFSLPYKNLLCC